MRETISYKWDEQLGELIQKIKQKPENFLRGLVKVELFDSLTGKLKERQETENICLHVDYWLRMAVATALGQPFGMQYMYLPYGKVKDIQSCFEYMCLTDENSAEDANSLIVKGKQIGNYLSSGTIGAPYGGTYNNTESYSYSSASGKITNFRKRDHKVIDYPTDRGNGTFQKIWWWHPKWYDSTSNTPLLNNTTGSNSRLPCSIASPTLNGCVGDAVNAYQCYYSSPNYMLDVIDLDTMTITGNYNISDAIGSDLGTGIGVFRLLGIDENYLYFYIYRSTGNVIEFYKFDKTTITKVSKHVVPSSIVTTLGTSGVYPIWDGVTGKFYLYKVTTTSNPTVYTIRMVLLNSTFDTVLLDKSQSTNPNDVDTYARTISFNYTYLMYDGIFYSNRSASADPQVGYDFETNRILQWDYLWLVPNSNPYLQYNRWRKVFYWQSGNYIYSLVLIPSTSQTLLAEPVTKTNLHTMKIQYDIEYIGYDIWKDYGIGK